MLFSRTIAKGLGIHVTFLVDVDAVDDLALVLRTDQAAEKAAASLGLLQRKRASREFLNHL